MAPQRILITGADGFVGRHAAAAFRAAGHTVLEAAGPHVATSGMDLADAASVRRAVEAGRPDAILHLAGVSSVAQSHQDPILAFRINALGTVHLLEAVRTAAPTARVLCVSSGEVYGAVPSGSRAIETDLCIPRSPYAASKVAAEAAALQYHRSYGTQVLLARSFNHIGPGQHPNFVVPSFAAQLVAIARGKLEPVLKVGNLEPVRDFLHVSDVVAAYLLLLERGEAGRAYNICSGEPRRIRDILDELIKLSGADAKVMVDPGRLRPAEIDFLVGDPTRLKGLGWRPRGSVTQALREVLAEVGSS